MRYIEDTSQRVETDIAAWTKRFILTLSGN
jgi:hypothetical protein